MNCPMNQICGIQIPLPIGGKSFIIKGIRACRKVSVFHLSLFLGLFVSCSGHPSWNFDDEWFSSLLSRDSLIEVSLSHDWAFMSVLGIEKGFPIRYSTDGSEPSESSSLYSEGFDVCPGMVVRSKVFLGHKPIFEMQETMTGGLF